MKRIGLILAVAGLTVTSVVGQQRETRAVSGFTGIEASSVFDITVSKGDAESLLIEADSDIMPFVRAEVRDGVLHLFIDNSWKQKSVKTLRASVVMRSLDKVTLSGASKIAVNDLFAADDFSVKCSGTSQLKLHLNVKQLNVSASGACKIHISGHASENLWIDVSGTTNFQGELRANTVMFNSSGVSSVYLSGSATDIIVNASGTSRINAENFAVKTAIVNSAGTSKIIVNVEDSMIVNSAGASSVNYKGSPAIQTFSSGTSKIRGM